MNTNRLLVGIAASLFLNLALAPKAMAQVKNEVATPPKQAPAKLDSPPEHFKIFSLKYSSAEEVAAVLATLQIQTTKNGKTSQLNLSADSRSNSLIARGNEEMLTTVTDILSQLDQPSKERMPPSVVQQIQIRVIWLTSNNPSAPSEKTAIPSELAPVIKELDRIGINNLSLGGQLIGNARIDSSSKAIRHFAMKGVAGSAQPMQITITGDAKAGENDGTNLQITVNLSSLSIAPKEVQPIRKVGEVSIVADVTAPMNHFVVLGVTPNADSNSVFVLQIRPTGPIAPQPTGK